MRKLSSWILRHHKSILLTFIVLSILSAFAMPLVRVNYDNSLYLPPNMETRKSLNKLQETFGVQGSAQVMISNVSIPQALEWKEKLSQINGIAQVIWLDDAVDIRQAQNYISETALKSWYIEQNALFQLSFTEDDYSTKTEQAIKQLQKLDPEKVHLRGPAIDAISTRSVASSELKRIILWIIPILLLVLVFSSKSWIEPLLFMLTIGASVVINMGSNLFLPKISYLTQTIAGILQLAIAMDYSIFLMHRYREERSIHHDPVESMKNAMVETFSSISGSSMTTIASFVVLMFMRYRIGMDMGLVLVKGILLSLVAVIFLLPALIILLEPLIDRCGHASFFPRLDKIFNGILKLKIVVPLIFLLIAIPSYLAQNSNFFLYGEAAASNDLSTVTGRDSHAIESVFGRYNPLLIMVPSGQLGKEIHLAREFQTMEYVLSVQALATLVDPAISRNMLPEELKKHFEQKGFSLMILYLDTPLEGEVVYSLINEIKQTTQNHYDDKYYVIGTSSSIADIKQVVEYDFLVINLASMLIIALILLLVFRSIVIPFLLILVIEVAIWINMAIPYFTGTPLIFIGFMIVNTVQLGATIDYAILLTSRYSENRKKMDRISSIEEALKSSGISIITSALIVAAAGICLALVSAISGVSSIGLLIGRGALISCILVLLVLPQFLYLADPLIFKKKKINKQKEV